MDIGQDRVSIDLRRQSVLAMLSHHRPDSENAKAAAYDEEGIRLDLQVRFKRRSVEMKLVLADERKQRVAPDPHSIGAVAQGHQWFAQISDGDAKSVRGLAQGQGVDQSDVSRILPLAFLAPDIVEAILVGRQPTVLPASRLKRTRNLPISWAEQRRSRGFV